jgi:dipeptidyl aminopeptidase/acylaminoacyl peptidase
MMRACARNVSREAQMRINIMLAAATAFASITTTISPTAHGTDFDAAAAFGARPSVADFSLSPDGKTIAYIAPAAGQGSVLYTMSLEKGAKAHRALAFDGNPTRLSSCNWIANDRLVCYVYGVVKTTEVVIPLLFNRTLAVNADGSHLQVLSTSRNSNTRGWSLNGGEVIDWLPDEDGAVLMSREYLPDDHVGSLIGANKSGLGVDHVDTRTLKIKPVEGPKEGAYEYLTDGRGSVRIAGFRGPHSATQQDTGMLIYQYRPQNSSDWRRLSVYNSNDESGFLPLDIDHDKNIAYGTQKKDGRLAVYSVKLDESLQQELVYDRADVDVTKLIHIGRRNRVVGVAFATDVTNAVYFDEDLKKLVMSLSKALPGTPNVRIADSSVEEDKLLIYESRDNDPGSYYLFDRKARELRPLFAVREELDGVKLAEVTPMTFTAGDGTKVPGYITYPPGKEKQKGLPAIVMPHGGPSARDTWGFDWWAQFYANRGFVVLQPNFRGSSGYGDAWYRNKGFRSWGIAVGDVLDAGRWMVSQGIADPDKLAIVGWSYGGYAALQSAVVDSSVFKAVIAVAPVSDLADLKEESRGWSNEELISQFVGDEIRQASPAQNASRIKAPVLLFHGKMDRNVAAAESRHMDRSLTAANVPHELVLFDDLDHRLDDSKARADMLRKSDEFLRKNLHL